MARIWHCCGSGIVQQLQLQLDPPAWEPPYATGAALKKKTKKKRKRERKKERDELLLVLYYPFKDVCIANSLGS